MVESIFASLIASALYDGIKSNLKQEPVVQEQVLEQKGIEWHIVSKETKNDQ